MAVAAAVRCAVAASGAGAFAGAAAGEVEGLQVAVIAVPWVQVKWEAPQGWEQPFRYRARNASPGRRPLRHFEMQCQKAQCLESVQLSGQRSLQQ